MVIVIDMHQREEKDSCYVRISRRGRSKSHFFVTAASRRRLNKLVNRHIEKFMFRPYITETVGWVATSK